MKRKSIRPDNVYVIIPVYNEASVIGSVIRECQSYYRNIVCVDDGSIDNSARAVNESGAVLIRHAINLGAGAATQTGIDYALSDPGAKYFITIDADGQHEIEDAHKMLTYLKVNDLDVVIGSRFLGSVKNITKTKRSFLRLAAVFSKRTSGIELSDPHNGIRVFTREFAENLKLKIPGYAHASELIHRIAEKKYKYAEFPVSVSYSDYSKSKGQSMLNAVNITVDFFHHKLNK